MDPGRQSGLGRILPLIPLLRLGSILTGYGRVNITPISSDSNETHVLALPLSIQCFERGIERMFFRDIDHVVTPGVPTLFVVREILMIRCHSIQETRRVNERQ